MKYTYEMVNAGLNKVIEYLNSIENVWNETRNLKLYDVSFQAGDIIDRYPLVKEEYSEVDLFSRFCDDQYYYFSIWMKEETLEDCRKYIGRTSTFYLTDMHDDIIGNVVDLLMNRLYGCDIDYDDNGYMLPFTDTDYYTEAELIIECQDEMRYMADGDFLADVKKYFEDAVKIAEYIDDFKENQIEYFTNFIENINNDLECEAEQADKEEQAFIEKYGMAIGRLTADIEKVVIETGCTIAEATRMIHKAMEQVKPLEVVKEEIA